MKTRKPAIAIYVLICALQLISCTNQSVQKVEALPNISSEQNKNAINSSANENKINVKKDAPDEQTAVKPSQIIAKVREKKKTNPTISSGELTAYANELLQSNGYDFGFDWEPKGKSNEANLAKLDFKTYLPFEYEFIEANGKPRKFQLLSNGFEHPCYSIIDVPVTKVTEKTMTVVADGKEIELRRPKDFGSEEMVLLDKLKKPIRKWQTPFDATPLGVSADGRKLYFDSWNFYQDETDNYKETPINLAVEISEDGSLKMIDVSELKSDKGVDFGYDKKNTETQYKKFKVGEKEFIIQYPSTCS